MTTRAVANPVGVILILGMTILSVGALLTVGGAVVDDTRADAEHSQMENSMSAFSSKASLVGLGESGHQRFSLGRVSQGRVDVREDAGRVHVKIQRNGTNETVRETSMGAVVYENDGREIAYQGGGVWARQGDFSRMLSPPEFHYRAETLTFPIINVTGDGAASGDIRGTVRSDTEAQQWYPDDSEEDFDNPLTNGTVYVEIESEYCRGWQSFFETRTQGAVEQGCDGNSTVTVRLDTLIEPVFGAVVTARSIEIDSNQGNGKGNGKGNGNGGSGPNIDGPTREGVVAPSVSDEVDDRITACLDNGCSAFSSGDHLDAGTTYYTENAANLNGITADVADGDVNIIINTTGDVDLESFNVSGSGGRTFLYIKTDSDIDISGDINSAGEPERFVMYVHSDVPQIHLVGNEEFRGGLYAPRSDFDGDNGNGKGCGAGSISLTGSVVVDNFCFRNGEFTHDEDMEAIDVDIGLNTVKYLHVSENTAEIDLE